VCCDGMLVDAGQVLDKLQLLTMPAPAWRAHLKALKTSRAKPWQGSVKASVGLCRHGKSFLRLVQRLLPL